MDELHSLLRRQLKRHFGSLEAAPPGLRALLEDIDAAYRQFDEDRRMLERTLELSSQELLQGNAEMRSVIAELNRIQQDLRVARDQAQEASQAKSRFLANMSHELRTPLSAILGYTELLIEDAERSHSPDQQRDLRKIHAAAMHLLALINDILDLSKVEAGRMTVSPESFPLSSLVNAIVVTVRPLIEKNGNRFVVSCPTDLGMVHTDDTKLRQVLFNLLSNSGKFTRDGEVRLHVTREAAPEGDWLLFQVTDTGIGIEPDQLSRIFEPFTQADASTTRKYGGTGLGLAISRRFCQLLGGDITVESQLGTGSTFTARIPASLPPSP